MKLHGASRTLFMTLLLLAAVSVLHGETLRWNRHRGYHPFSDTAHSPLLLSDSCDSSLSSLVSLPIPGRELTFSFRSADCHSHPLKRYSYNSSDGRTRSVGSPGWRLVAIGVRGDTLRFRFHPEESMEAGDGISSTRAVRLTTEYIPPHSHSNEKWSETRLTTSLDAHSGWNSICLRLADGTVTLSGGIHTLHTLLQREIPLSAVARIGFEIPPGGSLKLDHISLDTSEATPSDPRTATPEGMRRLIRQAEESPDEMEGEWVVYDRNLDESRLRSGGEYRLLMLSDHDGYDLLYLDGARVCADRWTPGRVKARLRKGDVPGVWKVIWHDSEGNPLSRDTRAQYDTSTSLLTISFPYSSGQLRLYPVRK